MKKLQKTPLSMTVGMLISASCAASAVHADVNPFAATELTQPALQLARVVPAETSSAPAAKSGAAPAEMSCGAMVHGDQGGAKGAGEMSCGAMMQDKSEKSSKAMGEMSCGAMMKDMPASMSNDEKKAQCMKKMMQEHMQAPK